MKLTSKNIEFVLYLSATYLLILAFRGFAYASGDMVEVINYAKHMINHDLFNNDFYISHISAVTPNERIVFSNFLKYLLIGGKCTFFITHFVLTIAMLIGVYKISSIFVKQKALRWLIILILFGPLYKINLGGNELYYNMLISSFVAKVFGVWALYFFLKSNKAPAIILVLVATIIHPTVGSQLFIIFVLSMFIGYLTKRTKDLSLPVILSIFFFFVLAGGYIYLLLSAVHDYSINKNLYFEIFEFRVPHHFFPQYFPLKNYVIEVALFVVGLFAMIKLKMGEMIRIYAVVVLGIVVYLIGVVVLKIPFVLNTQWFKSTIWLELISLIALMAYIEKYLELSAGKSRLILVAVLGFSVFVWVLVLSGNSHFVQKPYQFCQNIGLDEEEKLGESVKKLTGKDAVFVWPIEFSGFKFYSERGAFVDYKSVVHRGTVLSEWYEKIKFVYGIDINTRRENIDIKPVAANNYRMMNKEFIDKLKEQGIDYIVQYSDVNLNLPVIIRTNRYVVYKIER